MLKQKGLAAGERPAVTMTVPTPTMNYRTHRKTVKATVQAGVPVGNKEIPHILGLRTKATTLLGMANAIDKGLPVRSIDHIKATLKLSDVQVSSTLGVSAKTLGRIRKMKSRRLPVTIGDRLYRIAHLFALAKEVLEDENVALEWLRTPQVGLNSRTPFELMTTEAGAREVEYLLGRIEYGVLS